MADIPIVTILEYPTVVLFDGFPFAADGFRYSWHNESVTNCNLSGQYVEHLFAVLENEFSADKFIFDPFGRVTWTLEVSEGCRIAICSLPKQVLSSGDKERKRVQRYAKDATRLSTVLTNCAVQYLTSRATAHQVPNLNGIIIGACDTIDAGVPPEKSVLTIRKACFQLRALMVATKVMATSWRPNLDSNPLNHFHRTLTMLRNTWKDEFDNRGVRIVISENQSQVHMDSEIFSMIFTNLFSNISKYAKQNSQVAISFVEQDSHYGVEFAMTSSNIYPDETSNIFAPNYRGRTAIASGKPGFGLGLAIVRRAMRAYGGQIDVVSGDPDSEGSGFAKNSFRVLFCRKDVRG